MNLQSQILAFAIGYAPAIMRLTLLVGCLSAISPAAIAVPLPSSLFALHSPPVPHLGTEADDGRDPIYAARIDAINPQYVRLMAVGTYWSEIATGPDPSTWDWSRADQTIAYNFAKGRRIIHEAFKRPKWQTNDAEFMRDYQTFLRLFYTRYRGKIYAAQIWNEPNCLDPITQHDGALPVPNCPTGFYEFLVDLYRQSRATIKAIDSRVLITGPDWQSAWNVEGTKRLWDLGAWRYLDVLTLHEYRVAQVQTGGPTVYLHPDQSWTNPRNGQVIPSFSDCLKQQRKAMGSHPKPIWITELALWGRSATSQAHPNTGFYSSGFTEQEGTADARRYVQICLANKVQVIIPHVMPMATSNPALNYEIYGYEFAGTAMKSKTRAFIDVLRTGR